MFDLADERRPNCVELYLVADIFLILEMCIARAESLVRYFLRGTRA